MTCVWAHTASRIPGGGGGVTWMWLPDIENLTFSIPIFCRISHPSVNRFSKEKHPILTKLGALYNNLPKIHPIYVIWAPSAPINPPPSLYQISRKSALKGRHIYVYHVNMWTPPRVQNEAMALKWLGSATVKDNFLLDFAKFLTLPKNIFSEVYCRCPYYTLTFSQHTLKVSHIGGMFQTSVSETNNY